MSDWCKCIFADAHCHHGKLTGRCRAEAFGVAPDGCPPQPPKEMEYAALAASPSCAECGIELGCDHLATCSRSDGRTGCRVLATEVSSPGLLEKLEAEVERLTTERGKLREEQRAAIAIEEREKIDSERSGSE
jgi:hypothetical protein